MSGGTGIVSHMAINTSNRDDVRILSLMEQLKTKDEEIATKDEHIVNLEQKIVHLSLEYASAKAGWDDARLLQRRQSDMTADLSEQSDEATATAPSNDCNKNTTALTKPQQQQQYDDEHNNNNKSWISRLQEEQDQSIQQERPQRRPSRAPQRRISRSDSAINVMSSDNDDPYGPPRRIDDDDDDKQTKQFSSFTFGSLFGRRNSQGNEEEKDVDAHEPSDTNYNSPKPKEVSFNNFFGLARRSSKPDEEESPNEISFPSDASSNSLAIQSSCGGVTITASQQECRRSIMGELREHKSHQREFRGSANRRASHDSTINWSSYRTIEQGKLKE